MANIAIINNNGSVLSSVNGSEINLTSPQTVKLQINPKDVADMGRAGNDLQLTMSNGEKVTLKNFFTADAEGNVSKLVLQDAQGALWWVQNPEVGMSTIQPVGDISALGDEDGNSSSGGAIFPWLLGAAGIAGVAALVASGGGSSTHSDDNNSGNDTTAPGPVTNLLVTDDKAPIIGNITNNGVTNDTTPTLSGNAEAGTLVTIFDGSTRLGSVVVGSDGKWSFTPSTPLGEGQHSLTTIVTDASGNASERSPAFTLTVDTVAPDISNISATDNTAPQTGPLTSGSSTNDTTPTFSGTAEAGSVITIYDANTVLGSVTVGSDGKWSFTPSTALSEGSHSLSTTVTDAAGNVSDRSAFFAFKVDTSAPASSALTATDNTAPQTGPIANGASTNDTTPTLSGSAEAGAKITIYDGSTVLGSVVAGSDGKWSFTPSSPLGQGSHSLTSTVTDAAGNVSAHSPALTITVDTSAPAVPTLQTISDNVGMETGNLSRGATTDDTTPTLSGTAEAGAKITIYDGSTVLGTVTAGSDGKWSFTSSALGTGSHSFSVTATDAAGNVSAHSQAFTITIDPNAVSNVGNFTVTDDVAPVTGTLTSGASTNDTTPTFSGTAVAGTTVIIRDGNTVLGSVSVGSNGQWSFTPPTLPQGAHSFTTEVTNAAGQSSGRSPVFTLTVDTTAPTNTVAPGATDDQAPVTGTINDGDSTNDKTPTFNGSGEAGAIVIIYDGETVIGSTTVGSNGSWSFTPGTALGEGSHTITTTLTDKAGNVSGHSPGLSFTVDTVAPDAPTTAPTATDDVAPVTGVINDGDSTNDNTPTLSGTGTDGDIIIIYDGATVIGSTTVEGGTWTFTPGTPLGEGSHTITTTVTDKAGNESGHSPGLTITVDTVAPTNNVAPTATDDVNPVTGAIADGGSTNDTTPTLGGSGEAGDLVIIYDGEEVIGSTTVGNDGTWTFTPTTPLGEGDHSLSTTLTDKAGNTSDKSPSLNFTVDTVAPDAPAAAPTATDDVAPITGIITDGDNTNDSTPTFSGTGTTGDLITIYDGDTAIGSVTVGGDGTWTFTPGTPLGEGSHSISTTVTDAAGNESEHSPSLSFTVDTVAPDAPATAPTATDDVDPVTGLIADGDATNDNTPTFNGTGTAGDLITIYDGDTAIGSVTVGGDGTWTFTPTDALGEGSHSISTTVTDAAGNESEHSPSLSFTVDTVAPDAPATAPTATDDVDPVTGLIANGDSTNDNTPTFNGTGTAGDLITIYDGDTAIGSVTVGGDGTWTFTPTDVLGEGSHSISTTVTDAAGNESEHSPSLSFTVDTVAPDAPLLAPLATDDAGLIVGPIL